MGHKTLVTFIAASLALAASGQALAYGAGDLYTRIGVAKVSPKSDNGTLDTAPGKVAGRFRWHAASSR